jgi:hypothetical protein
VTSESRSEWLTAFELLPAAALIAFYGHCFHVGRD